MLSFGRLQCLALVFGPATRSDPSLQVFSTRNAEESKYNAFVLDFMKPYLEPGPDADRFVTVAPHFHVQLGLTLPRSVDEENFREFHQEIYRSVDNTSTTPFSQRSLDRGSPTALAILLRMGIPELSQRKSLKNFRSGKVREKAEKLRDSFTECISVREGHSDVETHNELIRESKTTFEAYYSRLSSFVTKCLIDNCGASCDPDYDTRTQECH